MKKCKCLCNNCVDIKDFVTNQITIDMCIHKGFYCSKSENDLKVSIGAYYRMMSSTF